MVVPMCRGFGVEAVREAAVGGVLGGDRWPSTSEFRSGWRGGEFVYLL